MKMKNCFSILLLLLPFISPAQSTAKEWYKKGIELKASGKINEALDDFNNAIAKKANYNEALYQAGWCSNELENHEEAIAFLEKYKPSSRADKKNRCNELGYSYYKLGRSRESVDAYSQTLALYPDN